jgi:hypothetical protein
MPLFVPSVLEGNALLLSQVPQPAGQQPPAVTGTLHGAFSEEDIAPICVEAQSFLGLGFSAQETYWLLELQK